MIYILYSLVKKNNDKVRKEMETNEKKQGEISLKKESDNNDDDDDEMTGASIQQE